MEIHLSRRDLLQVGVSLAAAGYTRQLCAQEASTRNHFFLQVIIPGGADSLYMFDSRPLAFTAAGKVANYAGSDPSIWQGSKGNRCLASPFTSRLRPYKPHLAIVNGVHMPPGFEGHDQNVNALLSANPFGGRYFGPFLGSSGRALDFISLGTLAGANISNKERSLTMAPRVAPELAAKAATVATLSDIAPWRQWVSARSKICGDGVGMLAAGCNHYQGGLLTSPSLAHRLAKTTVAFGENEAEIVQGAKVAFKYFTEGVADVCLIVPTGFEFDTHSDADAANSPEIFSRFMEDIASLFEVLVKTPFDADNGLSMLDVTTVMISSEFSRTHGQAGRPSDKTGTDHNPQSNMIILAGKGIKGDMVVGESDLDTLGTDGNFTNVSSAHKRLDQYLLKRMGKPYDFVGGAVSSELPTEYRHDDYISAASVINTVLAGFGVPENHWMTNDPSLQGSDKIPPKPLHTILT